jgi:hypothetical protein
MGAKNNDGGGYPIAPPHRAFYATSMLFNTQSACASIGVVAEVVDRLEEDYSLIEAIDGHEVLNELQNIVLQGAAVSKYFWPARAGHERRAEQLRNSLGIDETSPLHSRDLRNGIEHLDERLDRYLADGIVGYVIPQYFGRSTDSKGVPMHYFRAYFIDTGEFQLLDERYKIAPMAEALWALNKRLAGDSAA